LSREPGHWLQSPSVSLKLAVGICLFWITLLTLWELSPLAVEAETRIVNPLLFQMRQKIERAPQVNPHIKSYGMDDTTISYMQRPHLKLSQWVALLEAINSRSPKAIVIDSLFSVTDVSPDEQAERDSLAQRLKAIQTPILMGSYASMKQVRGREHWDLNDPAFDINHYLRQLPQSPLTADQEAAALPVIDYGNGFVYGPDVFLREALYRIGHIHYGQKEGRFHPFIRLQKNRLLPHVMVRASGEAYFKQGQLYMNEGELPLSRDGSAYINFPNRDQMVKSVRPLRLLLKPSLQDKELQRISSEDYVYIIQMYYTGNVDFKPSPIGMIPGAFSHLAVLNNILQKEWLRPIEAGPWLIAGFGCFAALLAFWLSPAVLIMILVASLCLWALLCFYAFAWLGLVIPWLGPSMSFFFIGLSIAGFRIRAMELKSWYIKQTLQGTVENKVLNELSKHPERLALEARERVLTIMFIDIVGFSLMVENQLPRTAFESLRSLIEELSSTVHRHGGIVNKTLGDGLLCFFGYSFHDDKESTDHAEQALLTALEIQRSNVPRMIRSSKRREPVFPLRIGINTSAVFLGNLGSGEKLDFTVIGNGVNFAKRLEGACLPHSVLVGPTTKELVEPLGTINARAKRRLIAIKHHIEMVESWEYDPFLNQPELRAQAEEVYKTSAYLTRVERRWSVAKPERILLTTLSGPAHLLNFSSTGMSFSLPGLIPRGTRLELNIDSADGLLYQQLAGFGLQKIQVEVRWVQKSEERYLHGVRYLDLDARQTDLITDLLCQYALAEFEDISAEDAAS
ncbi:MAG: CHASE2 domain-containing protein, partial [Pseudobdellovibrionaceae bacterium]|nr:CHASE2 domain-containing protein [Pseudobdellovibrionaceae bacterium]